MLAAWYENGRMMATKPRPSTTDHLDGLRELDMIIIGAESLGRKPGRACFHGHVVELVEQCKEAGVSCFVKQIHKGGKLIKEPAGFPREFPKKD